MSGISPQQRYVLDVISLHESVYSRPAPRRVVLSYVQSSILKCENPFSMGNRVNEVRDVLLELEDEGLLRAGENGLSRI